MAQFSTFLVQSFVWTHGLIVYCFIWLSQQAEALQEAIALSKTNY